MIAGPFVALFALVGVIAIIVWIVQWASDYSLLVDVARFGHMLR